MKYNLKRQEQDKRDHLFSTVVGKSIPKSIDMRRLMPPIYNQLELGSCTANSSVAYTVFLNSNKVELSRLFEYFKAREIEGTVDEDSGATNRDSVKAIKKNGVCEEKFMPYNVDKFTVAPTDAAIANAKSYTISSYSLLNSLTGIKQTLAVSKPIIIGMDVFESFEGSSIANTGIMPIPKKTEEYLGGHSVLVVGYIDGKNPTKSLTGCLIIRNSWGIEWGDKGYFYMPYEYLKEHTFDYWVMNK